MALQYCIQALADMCSFFGARSGALDGFFLFARVLAAVFLLIQLVVVLETVFRLNEVQHPQSTNFDAAAPGFLSARNQFTQL